MQIKNLKDKLIRVERTVNVYLKDGSEPLYEINIDTVPFNNLLEIVPPTEDDPLLYDGYELEPEQINSINHFLIDKIVPDFKVYTYILVAGGIYDWEK